MDKNVYDVVINELTKKNISLDEATKILLESNSTFPTFKKGERLYISHGIGAGSWGKFLRELNGGYAEVQGQGIGKTFTTPTIFLQKSRQ